MERFKNLSKREIVLIYALIMIAIVAVGVVFVVKPALSKAEKIDDRYQEAQLKASEMENTIRQKSDAELQTKELERKIKTVKKQYQKNMKSEEVDSLLTGLIRQSGLTPGAMDINGETTGATIDKSGTDAGAETKSNTSGTESNASGTESNAGNDTTQDSVLNTDGTTGNKSTDTNNDSNNGTAYNYVKVDTAMASATGSLTECINLIENARATKGVRVSAFNITTVENAMDQTLTSGFATGTSDSKAKTSGSTGATEYQIEIAFEVYEVKNL